MRLKELASEGYGVDISKFQFNCCAIKGPISPASYRPGRPFQFNCCAIKGPYSFTFHPGTMYFNSTVVRLKELASEGYGVDISKFQFNCCAIKGPISPASYRPGRPFQFNCCAIKGFRPDLYRAGN